MTSGRLDQGGASVGEQHEGPQAFSIHWVYKTPLEREEIAPKNQAPGPVHLESHFLAPHRNYAHDGTEFFTTRRNSPI
jgi:hypothetical protein